MNRPERMLNLLSAMAILLSFLGVSYLGYLVVFPINVAEVKSPAEVITKKVSPGDRFVYEIDSCMYVDTEVVIYRRLSNNIAYNLPELHKQSDSGCIKENISSFEIPKHIPPGVYTLKVRAVHRVNPLRDVTIEWETKSFEITP